MVPSSESHCTTLEVVGHVRDLRVQVPIGLADTHLPAVEADAHALERG